MKKSICAAVAAAALTLSMSMTAFAGQWMSDAKGWWWQNDDGSWPANGWVWLDGDKNGIAECYYFGGDGYLLVSTLTPDGYSVNANGAWVDGGVIQTKAVGTPVQAEAKNDSDSQETVETKETSSRKEVKPLHLCETTMTGEHYAGSFKNYTTTDGHLWSKGIALNNWGSTFNEASNEYSLAEYELKDDYEELTFKVAPMKDFNDDFSVWLSVIGDDDTVLWESDEMNSESEAENITVDISGQKTVRFYYTRSGVRTHSFDNANAVLLVGDPVVK